MKTFDFETILAVMQAIQESDCDQKMIERVTVHKELPGALWHIYRPWDADKIRDLINRVDKFIICSSINI